VVLPRSARLQPRAPRLRRPVSRPRAPRGHRQSRAAQEHVDTQRQGPNTLPRPRDRPWRREAPAGGARSSPIGETRGKARPGGRWVRQRHSPRKVYTLGSAFWLRILARQASAARRVRL